MLYLTLAYTLYGPLISRLIDAEFDYFSSSSSASEPASILASRVFQIPRGSWLGSRILEPLLMFSLAQQGRRFK
jgi:hypothetical protein